MSLSWMQARSTPACHHDLELKQAVTWEKINSRVHLVRGPVPSQSPLSPIWRVTAILFWRCFGYDVHVVVTLHESVGRPATSDLVRCLTWVERALSFRIFSFSSVQLALCFCLLVLGDVKDVSIRMCSLRANSGTEFKGKLVVPTPVNFVDSTPWRLW